jgi:hypothetical protein
MKVSIKIFARLFRFYRGLGFAVGTSARRAWRMAA